LPARKSALADPPVGGPAAPNRQVRILGPAPCAFPKLKGLHRFHLQLLGPDGDQLRAAVRSATEDLKPPEKVQWIVDVDAVEMM
jgi:primosomal protein N'